MKGPKLKPNAVSYERWLCELSEDERREHLAAVKRIVAKFRQGVRA